jgi:hypothetical protein
MPILVDGIRKLMLVMLIAATLSGCATHARRMNQMALGMTKAEVVRLLGEPASTSATEGTELLNYSFIEERVWGFPSPYYVMLREGRVVSYGRHGDFGVCPQK